MFLCFLSTFVHLFSWLCFWYKTYQSDFFSCFPFLTVCDGLQDISCIKDLTSLYEAAMIEDIYVAYEHLKVDDTSLFCCIGVAGAQAGEDISGKTSILYEFYCLLLTYFP